ncbi:MAG: alpha-2-macroglobulin [Acidobacteria bacterium]|nr:alpha-2-macroglobulin [Acidobacteriota bacterium]
MKITLLVCLLFTFFMVTYSQTNDYEKLKAEAEKFYQEKSYSRASEIYQKALQLKLSEKDTRWVKFRLADTLWRSQAATNTSDNTKFDQALEQLNILVRDIKREQDRDLVWAEVQESIGDFWWQRSSTRNWGQATSYYLNALDFWAGSKDLKIARERYLKIIFSSSRPLWAESYYYYGYYGNVFSPQILENALKIAATDNEKAHAYYLLAMATRYNGNNNQRLQVPEQFEAAIKFGKGSDWYDDALFYYAEWLQNYGKVIFSEDGQASYQIDFVGALKLYRQIVSEYEKGETHYFDQAQQRISEITRAYIQLGVSNFFLPDSEIQFSLSYRNITKIDLSFYKVDLTEHVRFTNPNTNSGSWLHQISLEGREKVKSWTKIVENKADYKPISENVILDQKLPLGAYVLEAKNGDIISKEIILVTNTAILVKTAGKQVLTYFNNAIDGSPIAGASIKLWQRYYNNTLNSYVWKELNLQTNEQGIAVFSITDTIYNQDIFVSATRDNQQAFSLGYNYYNSANNLPWRIYAFTDRPAYRPKEEAKWKFIARRYDGSAYSTPANETIEFEVTDPKGAKVKEGKSKLNRFGTAWDSLQLTETMPLGEYRIQFWDEGKRSGIGNAVLFRVEEYKLPEFKVSVKTPEDDGKKKAFRIGEKVEVNIQADYYFGGAVANATVQVVVYQNPFYHYYRQVRDYPWYYDDFESRYYDYYGNGQVIKQETLKTDLEGKAKLVFETPNYGAQDYEYRIEARVTDSSRREIIGSEKIRVTNQRYYVYLNPDRYLCRPEDNLKIKIKTIDANDNATAVEGNLKLVRDYWYEIWLDPNDKEIKGEELEKLRRQFPQFPPQTQAGEKPWRLKFRGYEHEVILTDKITTNKDGEAEFNAKPPKVGYYRLEWASKDKGRAPITSQATFWALNNQTTELGYRYNTVQIILDKDTVRVGEKASVMITVPNNDRYVLFSTEADDLYSYQLLHLTGTVQLVEIPIEQKHVPNIFLQAQMVWDRQVYVDQKQLIVPPTKNFLTVDVKADREQYQPREEGTLTINTRDENGQGVAAEIALGLVDESVFYIQSDYAGDPRQFYFGNKRSVQVQNFNTFQQKRYIRLVPGQQPKQLVEEGQLQELRAKANREQGEYDQDGAIDNRVMKELPSVAADSTSEVVTLSAQSAEFGRAEGKAGAANAPKPAAPAKALAKKRDSGAKDEEKAGLDDIKAQGGGEPPVQVRSDFRSTVFWQPDVTTDAQGRAVVKIKYPDNLTSWKALARVVTTDSQFGIAETSTRTKQPLIVRLQAPRFFLVGDLTVVSGVINNNTDKAITVSPSLTTSGLTITGLFKDGKALKGEQVPVEVPANGERRIDWVVSASKAGDAKLKVTALNKTYSDAMENSYIVYEHGIEKFITKAGKMRGSEVTVSLNIPKERKTETTNLVVQVAPSMAVTMLDALPYLIDYPYGCTEQTMSRFLPAAIMAKTLRELGLNPEKVMGRYFGGIEEQFVNKTQPKGKKDLAKLDDMVYQGLNRLYDFQHSDGGWGWWKEGSSDHFMTAYVLWGMTLAYHANIDLKFDVAKRASNYLDKELVEEERNLDQQAWMLHALAAFTDSVKGAKPSEFQRKAFNNLWENREKLNAYTRALLALTAHYFGEKEKAMVLVRNLEDGVKRDNTPDVAVIERGAEKSSESVIGTAHWGEDGIYYRWSDGGIESTSFVLRALLTIDPQNKLIEPITNWLVKNRRGAQWSNTRDTAITILALNDYLKTSGELKPELEYELLVNGKLITTKKLSGEDALAAPSQFPIDRKMIVDGANEIRIRRKNGNNPLYFAAQATFFSLENPIPAAGNEVFVRRDYYKIVSKPTLLKGFVYEKEQMQDKDKINSGDRIQVVLTIEAKNNYEYLLFEDLKPAGIEAVQIRSGEALYTKELKSGTIEKRFASKISSAQPIDEDNSNQSPQASARRVALNREALEETVKTETQSETDNLPDDLSREDYTGRSRWVYQELRDRKVALFIDKLPEGVWEIRYEFRAETPGEFHALPVLGHAMYVPEIRCNSKEIRISVTEEQK